MCCIVVSIVIDRGAITAFELRLMLILALMSVALMQPDTVFVCRELKFSIRRPSSRPCQFTSFETCQPLFLCVGVSMCAVMLICRAKPVTCCMAYLMGADGEDCTEM
jgi:hypothetical protein